MFKVKIVIYLLMTGSVFLTEPILGKDFKICYSNTKYYILLKDGDIYEGLKIKEGLNINDKGFKFISFHNLKLHFNKDIKYIREVKIMDDSVVYQNYFYHQSKILFLEKKIPYEIWFMTVSKDTTNFRYIKKRLQTYELCKLSTKELINLKFIRKDLLDKELFEMFIMKINKL